MIGADAPIYPGDVKVKDYRYRYSKVALGEAILWSNLILHGAKAPQYILGGRLFHVIMALLKKKTWVSKSQLNVGT